ncbi:MAG TPA: hypothetical protein VFA15_02570 [Nitrososphaera sp.]|nr:hypothetical protein [Nitrososphaera sp.]
MSEYTKFDLEIYSEELQPVSEAEYDEVMQAIAEESDWQGYEDFSRELESENFIVRDGKVYHKPEPRSMGRIGGIEL